VHASEFHWRQGYKQRLGEQHRAQLTVIANSLWILTVIRQASKACLENCGKMQGEGVFFCRGNPECPRSCSVRILTLLQLLADFTAESKKKGGLGNWWVRSAGSHNRASRPTSTSQRRCGAWCGADRQRQRRVAAAVDDRCCRRTAVFDARRDVGAGENVSQTPLPFKSTGLRRSGSNTPSRKVSCQTALTTAPCRSDCATR
jgi:hypothetical protein